MTYADLDTALDGRRDFTDAQASLFLDEVASEFKQ